MIQKIDLIYSDFKWNYFYYKQSKLYKLYKFLLKWILQNNFKNKKKIVFIFFNKN